jgi:REP element-mobilizing transposase RayT
MPRQPRLDIAHIPQHIVQRGNDRQPCFFSDVDRERYLQELRELALREHCAVHAYVLMTNHVHLLMTPSAAGQIGHLMQSLGRRYVRYVNDRYHRTGTLWEGRYKSSPVDSETYRLHCPRTHDDRPAPLPLVEPRQQRFRPRRPTDPSPRNLLSTRRRPKTALHCLSRTDARSAFAR